MFSAEVSTVYARSNMPDHNAARVQREYTHHIVSPIATQKNAKTRPSPGNAAVSDRNYLTIECYGELCCYFQLFNFIAGSELVAVAGYHCTAAAVPFECGWSDRDVSDFLSVVGRPSGMATP